GVRPAAPVLVAVGRGADADDGHARARAVRRRHAPRGRWRGDAEGRPPPGRVEDPEDRRVGVPGRPRAPQGAARAALVAAAQGPEEPEQSQGDQKQPATPLRIAVVEPLAEERKELDEGDPGVTDVVIGPPRRQTGAEGLEPPTYRFGV